MRFCRRAMATACARSAAPSFSNRFRRCVFTVSSAMARASGHGPYPRGSEMARTAAGATLTRQHYLTQLALKAGASRDVTGLWRVVDPTNLTGTFDPVAQAAALLAKVRHRDSAGAAAGYQERFRKAEQVAGKAAIRLAAPLPRDLPPRRASRRNG